MIPVKLHSGSLKIKAQIRIEKLMYEDSSSAMDPGSSINSKRLIKFKARTIMLKIRTLRKVYSPGLSNKMLTNGLTASKK
jgi:hypothetical protein